MAISDLVAKAHDPEFYSAVMFMALRVAQNVASEDPATPEHAARVAYAQRIFRGDEAPALLAAHLIASNGTISAKILEGVPVPDGDIEYALSPIWTARSLSFAGV